MSPMKRIEVEILTSQVFSRIVQTMGKQEFMRFAVSKIVPIQGDLIVEGLGISAEEHELIVNNVDVIINSAASINLDEPLKVALNTNYFGAQRVLTLAKQCKKLKIFTHVSTAYVNCDRPAGEVREIIYEDGRDVDEVVGGIMKMSFDEVKEK